MLKLHSALTFKVGSYKWCQHSAAHSYTCSP